MVHPEDFEKKIGFDRIREMVRKNCLSPLGQNLLDKSVFMTDFDSVVNEVNKVKEFQLLISEGETFPLDHYYDLTGCLNKIRVEGSHPEVYELYNLKRSLVTIKSIFNFIKSKNSDKKVYPYLETVTANIKIFPYVLDTIDRILTKEGIIKDNASPELSSIRSEMKKLSVSVSRRLQTVLKQSQADGLVEKGTAVAIRNGRGVIPVNVYDKNKIKGLIHDQSATGKTVYIEPEDVVAMNNRLIELEYEEKRELIKILIVFADGIRPYIDELLDNFKVLGEIDFIRAKAVMGNRLSSSCPHITDNNEMEWVKAIHPLLFITFQATGDRTVVPLDIRMDDKQRIVLISGPNAGGKSVCLKTVGMLQYMFQCGFTVPVKEESRFRLFDKIFIDIGDEQDIDNDLSTYSSHLLNMKHFTKFSDKNTLILIDEFGTGTEPTLGAAIAEAILSRFNEIGVYGVLTTHYSNLKHFASSAEGIVNGAMMFDNHHMQPLFRLDIGKPGSSFAFEIARKIGLPEDILANASDKVGEDHINFDRHLKDILRDKRYWDKKRQNIRVNSNRLDELIEQYEKEMSALKSERKELISKAKTEAKKLIDDANKKIERTIKEIREAQAEKEKTKKIRAGLEEVVTDSNVGNDTDEKIERKIEKLREKEKNLKKTREMRDVAGLKTEAKAKTKEEVLEDRPLRIGDKVMIEGASAAGEVSEIKGKRVSVEFGNIKTTVDEKKLRRISGNEYSRISRQNRQIPSLDWEVTQRKSRFKPEIDLRGERAEAALEKVRDLVDEAIMVQYANLRILHGKGDGILRHLIREYLSTVDLVIDFRDEHIEAGGSGVTIVRLDV